MALSKSEAGKLGNLASRATHDKTTQDRKDAYAANPSVCPNCTTAIEYVKRQNKYCSKSCAATVNNTRVPKRATIKTTVTCAFCTIDFQFKKGENRTYCKQSCYLGHQAQIAKAGVESGFANGVAVKNYLIAKHGNVCLDTNCAWDFAKRPINVELEHIDGNSSNNVLSNCTLLCPNCHSQTTTYKGRNLGKGRRTLKRLALTQK